MPTRLLLVYENGHFHTLDGVPVTFKADYSDVFRQAREQAGPPKPPRARRRPRKGAALVRHSTRTRRRP